MTSQEWGVWSPESGGFVETGFWTETAAAEAARGIQGDDPDAEAKALCPDHEEQPLDGCEDCTAEDEEPDEDEEADDDDEESA